MNGNRVFICLAVVCGAAVLPCASLAQVVNFNFPINIAQETPAPNVTGLDPLPSGFGSVALDTSTNEISWEINYSNLSGPIGPPGAHFHGPALPGATAGVQVFISDGDPAEPATGVLTGTATLDDTQEADLLAGLWYVNIHTGMNQPGEIRGQVVIPEPATVVLALVAVAFAFVVRRKR